MTASTIDYLVPRDLPHVTLAAQDRLALNMFIYGAVLLEAVPIFLGSVKLNSPIYMVIVGVTLLLRPNLFIRNLSKSLYGPLYWIFAYAIYTFCSFSWSFLGVESAFQALPILVMLMGAVLLCTVPIEETIAAIVRAFLWVCAISWALGLLLPSVGAVVPPGWRLNGLLIHPQRLALMTIFGIMIVAIAQFARLAVFKTNRAAILSVAAFAVTLLATQTRAFTTYGVLALGFVAFMFVRPRWKLALLLGGAAVAGFALLNPDVIEILYEREGTSNETLSGRTTIWSNTYRLALNEFWNGHGFASFPTELTQNFFRNYTAPHAHNDVLNVFFETGAIGVLLLAGFVLTGMYYALRRRTMVSGYLLVLCVMCGLTGVILGAKLSLPTAIVVLLTAQELTGYRQRRRTSRLAQGGGAK